MADAKRRRRAAHRGPTPASLGSLGCAPKARQKPLACAISRERVWIGGRGFKLEATACPWRLLLLRVPLPLDCMRTDEHCSRIYSERYSPRGLGAHCYSGVNVPDRDAMTVRRPHSPPPPPPPTEPRGQIRGQLRERRGPSLTNFARSSVPLRMVPSAAPRTCAHVVAGCTPCAGHGTLPHRRSIL